jgi:hypothetical protein
MTLKAVVSVCALTRGLTEREHRSFQPAIELYRLTTASGRRILVPRFVDRGLSRGQRDGKPTAGNLTFIDWSCYFFFQVALHLSSRGWVDAVPEPLLLRKCSGVGNPTLHFLICSQEL